MFLFLIKEVFLRGIKECYYITEIEFEESQHTESKILNADLVMKSPGIPDTIAVRFKS